ncbi:MAG: Asp-tRNA(Asn)/Glu-tRNA(Gln) amidotransferase subunit GatC [Microscillaceae bacterium]|nr:Asp-tRNA(Asn)/Glu-tRNA(Gln) amidotransferase subunit GatC [Microscillaceae bacterium]
MKLNKDTLAKIAHLARLDILPEQEDSMLADFNKILAWVDALDEIDTSQVEPLTHISLEINSFREDQIKDTLEREKALSLAPQSNEEYFEVPKVIDL